jgi:NADH:ubiquinone oxidoreductase subunit K
VARCITRPDLCFLHALPFYKLAALLTATVGFIGLLLRQPMIVSFIALSVLAGPAVLGIIQLLSATFCSNDCHTPSRT